MGWLNAAGSIILITGLLLLFSGELVNKISRFFSATILTIDDKISGYRVPAGILLVLIGAWLVWIAVAYEALWLFYIIGGLALLFGILYLLSPNGLTSVSKIADRLLFSTDEAVLSTRRVTGLLLVLISLYIFYGAFRS